MEYCLHSTGFPRWSVLLLWALFLLVPCHRFLSFGCPVEEYEALMELRTSMVQFFGSSPSTWGKERNCCLWEQVSCNNKTRRVSKLTLSYLPSFNQDRDIRYWKLISRRFSWKLNFSIFSSFHELQHLNLSHNRIDGSLDNIPGLKKLTRLDLSNNFLTGSIPSHIRNLSSLGVLKLKFNRLNGTLNVRGLKKLKVLDLEGNFLTEVTPLCFGDLPSLEILDLDVNFLTGSLIFQALDGMTNLHELHIRHNRLNGSLPQSVSQLTSLRYLDLSDNMMVGDIPPHISNLTSLQHIDLSNNLMVGDIPSHISNLTSLQHLDLSHNMMVGDIPPHVSNLMSLQHLDLSNNLLNGDIPPHISNLTSLQYLDLSDNLLNGHLSFRSFANHSKLEGIGLSNNAEVVVDLNDGGHASSFQLRILKLSSCRLERETLTSPVFLSSQHRLEMLDLSHNNLPGNFPSWLLANQTRLEILRLGNNSLGGSFIWPGHPNENVAEVDVSMNFLAGSLPANIGMVLLGLAFMNFSSNNLVGDIPSSLGNMRSLQLLDLSNNAFTGFPSNLSANRNLLMLDVHNNQLRGRFPTSITALSSLSALNLRENNFEGRIPSALCNLTVPWFLDISDNNFSGSLSCVPSSKGVDLAGNAFTGSIPTSLFNSTNVRALDASNNQFSGSLPTDIGDQLGMEYLILRGNCLEGPIPDQLCNMQRLQVMDVSHNRLSGSLPPCLGQMQFYDPAPDLLEFGFLSNEVISFVPITEAQEVEFIMKGHLYPYKGLLLALISVIDVSANELTGSIPPEIGNLSHLISLNLSYNQLTGPIPATFSNRSQIESLDLSHNQLTGVIPWQLTQLKFLEVFSVAHNSLSGCIPEFKDQFATFNESSYVGNIGLHGPPLEKTCTSNSNFIVPQEENHDNRSAYIDDIIFYAICAASYILAFWISVSFLHCTHVGQQLLAQAYDYANTFSEWISKAIYRAKRLSQRQL